MNVEVVQYSEKKPHYLKMVIWRLLNAMVFVVFPNGLRIASLRLFGAKIGRQCLFCRGVKIYAPWNLKCGNAVCIGPRVEIYNKAPIVVGNNVVISQDAWLCTASHDIRSPKMDLVLKNVQISDNVWIAARASILPGVKIGAGAVVGACAVVTRDIEPWTVAAGNPALKVGRRMLDGNG